MLVVKKNCSVNIYRVAFPSDARTNWTNVYQLADLLCVCYDSLSRHLSCYPGRLECSAVELESSYKGLDSLIDFASSVGHVRITRYCFGFTCFIFVVLSVSSR